MGRKILAELKEIKNLLLEIRRNQKQIIEKCDIRKHYVHFL